MKEQPIAISKKDVQREFGARASAYVTSATHATGSDLARLVELAEPRSETDALDVATGGGHTALAVSSHSRSVVASDPSPAMLSAAAAFHRSRTDATIRYVAADSEDLPFASDSFDLVTCRIAPHHFSDVARAAREWARVLRPGGRLAMEDSVVPEETGLDRFINDLERARDYTHVRSYTEAEWRGFIDGAGMRIVHAETYHKEHLFVEWMSRGAMRNPESDRPWVEAMLVEASAAARAAFRIVFDNLGKPVRFADTKWIVLAVKPE